MILETNSFVLKNSVTIEKQREIIKKENKI